MNEAIKGTKNFIFVGLVLVLSFAACNKGNEAIEAIALTQMVLLVTLCRTTPQKLMVQYITLNDFLKQRFISRR